MQNLGNIFYFMSEAVCLIECPIKVFYILGIVSTNTSINAFKVDDFFSQNFRLTGLISVQPCSTLL